MTRLATSKDIQSVYDIYMSKEVIPFLGYDPMSLADFEPIYQELLDSNAFFIYELEGQTVGFYRVSYGAGRSAHVATISTLALNPSHHGKGVANAMLQELFETLKNAGIKRVELRVEADNDRGIQFYKKIGFQLEGTLKSRYKRACDSHYTDNLVMGLFF